MAQRMSDDQWRAFVAYGTRTGKLSTVRADGSPHVAPLWFLLDGDDVVFTTGKSSVKGRNLARDARAALCVDDERSPYAFVCIEGVAHLHEDLTEMRDWSTRIAARYVGAESAERYGERNAGATELLVRLRVARVTAISDIAE